MNLSSGLWIFQMSEFCCIWIRTKRKWKTYSSDFVNAVVNVFWTSSLKHVTRSHTCECGVPIRGEGCRLWGDMPLLLPGPGLPGLCCSIQVTDPGPGLCDRRGPGLWRGDGCCCIIGEGDGDIMGDCGVEGWWTGEEAGRPRGEWMTTDCCCGVLEPRTGGPMRRLGGPTLPGPCCWRCFCCCLLRYSCK